MYSDSDSDLTYANGSSAITLANATEAAETVAQRRPKLLRRYVALLTERGPLTDHESAGLLGVPNTSICSTRGALRDRVIAIGSKPGPWGAVNTTFALVGASHETEAA